MIASMIIIFVVGYILIATEHKLEVNKATFALLMSGLLWTVFSLSGNCPDLMGSLGSQLKDTCEILVFLIGAMTIVELIDKYKGFSIITRFIKAKHKKDLLVILSIVTFFMSAVLDNMTTTIIMVMLLRRLLTDQNDRWLFAGIIVIAANCGGAWSPIGDVTTIMLWMHNNVTSANLIENLFLPCLVALLIPVFMVRRMIKDDDMSEIKIENSAEESSVSQKLSMVVLIAGVAGLLFVPVFKTLTGLPPYMGMMISLGVLWLMTEIIVKKKQLESKMEGRVSQVIRNIDMPTILFFLGILMAVGALQEAGILTNMANWLDKNIHEPYIIGTSIGIISSVVDNVPLVAACINMYPVLTDAMVQLQADPTYAMNFIENGVFWHLLTFCAGVGGSLLIIGSAAGVVAMGIEKMQFWWYCKKITIPALVGYAAGILWIWVESLIF